MAHIKSAAGTRSELPVEPRTNTTLAGLMAFGEIEKGVPWKFYLGRRSCVMLAVGATSGGLVTIEIFVGEYKDGWAVFYDSIPCSMLPEMRTNGVRNQTGKPAVYGSPELAAILAKVVFEIKE